MSAELASPLNQAVLRRWEPVYRSQLHFLVMWTTRGRRPVLKERHARTLAELVPAICEERDVALVELALAQDHVHLLFGLRPSQSVATVVRELKGRTALQLLKDYPELRVWIGGSLLWDERYSVETVSPAKVAKVRERLRALHGGSEPIGGSSRLAKAG